MPRKTSSATPAPNSGRKTPRWLYFFYALPVLFVVGLLGFMAYNRATHKGPPVREISAAPFATIKINGLDARLFAQGNVLRASGDDLFIEFRDPQGALVDVGDVFLLLVLNMKGAVMHSTAKGARTAKPGQYRMTLDPDLAGEWAATLRYSGPRGQAETNFSVQVK